MFFVVVLHGQGFLLCTEPKGLPAHYMDAYVIVGYHSLVLSYKYMSILFKFNCQAPTARCVARGHLRGLTNTYLLGLLELSRNPSSVDSTVGCLDHTKGMPLSRCPAAREAVMGTDSPPAPPVRTCTTTGVPGMGALMAQTHVQPSCAWSHLHPQDSNGQWPPFRWSWDSTPCLRQTVHA